MIAIKGFLVLFAFHVYTTSALPPCVCTREMKPVCGTDGITYNNECLLKCVNDTKYKVTVDNPEKCKIGNLKPCICTYEYAPICGTDGNTYSNACELKCEQKVKADLNVRYQGECKSQAQLQDCVCTRNLEPVCGSNGVTYNNACTMRCADKELIVAKKGPC